MDIEYSYGSLNKSAQNEVFEEEIGSKGGIKLETMKKQNLFTRNLLLKDATME